MDVHHIDVKTADIIFCSSLFARPFSDSFFSHRDIPRIPESSHPPLESSKNSLKFIFDLDVLYMSSRVFSSNLLVVNVRVQHFVTQRAPVRLSHRRWTVRPYR